MNNNLPAIKQEAQLILGKSNSLIKLTNKILATRSNALATALKYKPFISDGHLDTVRSVVLTPDGKYIISGSRDNSIKIWDIQSGECIKTLIGHSDSIYSVSLTPDGKYIISGSRGNTIKVWDMENGECIRSYEEYYDIYNNHNIRIAEDGRIIIFITNKESKKENEFFSLTIKVLDFKNDSEITILNEISTEKQPLFYATNGKTIAIWNNKIIKIWDIQNAKCIKTIEPVSTPKFINISPNGRYIIFAYKWSDKDYPRDRIMNYIRMVDIYGIESDKDFYIEADKDFYNNKSIHSVTISPDARFLVSASLGRSDEIWQFSNCFKIWDIESGEYIKTIYEANSDCIISYFSPDGEFFILGDEHNNIIQAWETKSWEAKWKCNSNWLYSMAVDNQFIVLGQGDMWGSGPGGDNPDATFDINVLDTQHGNIIHTLSGDIEKFNIVILSEDGKFIYSASDTMVKMWDIQSGECLKCFDCDIGYLMKITLVIIKHEKVIIGSSKSCGDPNDYEVWDIQSEERIRSFATYQYSKSTISKDKNFIITTDENYYTPLICKIWDIQNSKYIQTFQEENYRFESIVRTLEGRLIFLNEEFRKIKIIDVQSGECICSIDGRFSEANITDDGQFIITKDYDKVLNIWDTKNGQYIKTLDEQPINEPLFDFDTNEFPFDSNSRNCSNEKFRVSIDKKNCFEVYDALSEKLIYSIFSFGAKSFISITPDGFFNADDMSILQHLRVQDTPMSCRKLNDDEIKYFHRKTFLSL